MPKAKRPPPTDPRIAAAQIQAQAKIQSEQLEAKEINDRIAADAHMEMARKQFEADQNDKERQSKMAIEMIQAQLSSAELSSVERQVLDKIKAGLAEKSMALNVTKDLALADHAVAIHSSRPPIEPSGRAENGKSFFQ